MNEFDLFFSNTQTILFFSKLVFGAIAVFLAILVWRKLSETYMLFFVIGILFYYANTLYKTVRHLGFINDIYFTIKDIPVGFIIFENLPAVFFIVAFSLFLRSKNI